MTYKVLSLKWRPQVFSDIVGQEHVTKTLINAFKADRIAQGYIFTGPRGVGKTTTARILSKGLNAEGGPRYDFDPNTNISEEISQGRALDVLEIDGASNRGIEEIRSLREQIKFAPMTGQYKVIIIDEVHMLTNPAFNALLRTLEEPPDHGKFIFCTTDIHKVPATIISRCQRFDFNRIATGVIIDRISFILENEKIKSDQASLQIIARKADGSMRDALSILDQIISYCGTDINYEQTISALGVISHDLYFEYTEALLAKDGQLMINNLEKFFQYSVPVSEIIKGLNNHIKNLLYSKINNGINLLDMNKESKNLYSKHSEKWDNRDLLRIIQIFSDVSSHINRSDDPHLVLEFTSLKLLEMDKSISLDMLLGQTIDPLPNSINSNVNINDEKPDQKKNRIDEKKLTNTLIDKKGDTDIIAKTEKADIEIDKDEGSNNINMEDDLNDSNNLNAISIDDLQDNWQSFIDNVHIKKPSIASILDKSIPIALVDGIITIKIASGLDFHISMIENNKNVINEILSSVFGGGIGFSLEKNTENDILSLNEGQETEIDNSENDEQVRDKIVDLFDGEILT
ncbi:MAG: hypothetical protein CBD77_01580 [bacterium TMED217]|nr:MAG: hypothetical protein CBD77_01580 [bacterium TMED217]|tara:strand:- start:8882 stop:10600 length:1719 start_codon:yes stop_codon:yes gene_type:complete